jgi:hypothetical protein
MNPGDLVTSIRRIVVVSSVAPSLDGKCYIGKHSINHGVDAKKIGFVVANTLKISWSNRNDRSYDLVYMIFPNSMGWLFPTNWPNQHDVERIDI